MRTFALVPIIILAMLLSLSAVYAQEKVDNLYFSLKVPETWTYAEYSNTGVATLLGSGPVNYVIMAPAEFGQLIVESKDDPTPILEKITDGGAFSEMTQDTNFAIKNAPLATYVNYKLGDNGTLNITSRQDTTVGKEKAVRVEATDTTDNVKFLQYMMLHDKEPYYLLYGANLNDYNKYLPDFEQMVKSFRFK